jgi:hypothetical protein
MSPLLHLTREDQTRNALEYPLRLSIPKGRDHAGSVRVGKITSIVNSGTREAAHGWPRTASRSPGSGLLDHAAFAATRLERGVAVIPAYSFAVAPAPAPRAVRVSLSAAADLEALRRGLEVVEEAVSGARSPGVVRL